MVTTRRLNIPIALQSATSLILRTMSNRDPAVGSHCELLRAGVPAFNKWRSQAPDTRPQLQQATFEMDLPNVNLKSANLVHANFRECNLSNAVFEDSNLSKATFFSCNLTNANFRNSSLRGASIIDANLTDADFTNNSTISRLAALSLFNTIGPREPKFTEATVPWFDRYLSWERLRFLARLNLFVPSYAALTLSVWYLYVGSWYNSIIDKLSGILGNSAIRAELVSTRYQPNVRHVLVILAFFLLSTASTTFILSPSQTYTFSMDQWKWDLKQPELLYLHSSWSKRLLRISCFILLLSGGAIR